MQSDRKEACYKYVEGCTPGTQLDDIHKTPDQTLRDGRLLLANHSKSLNVISSRSSPLFVNLVNPHHAECRCGMDIEVECLARWRGSGQGFVRMFLCCWATATESALANFEDIHDTLKQPHHSSCRTNRSVELSLQSLPIYHLSSCRCEHSHKSYRHLRQLWTSHAATAQPLPKLAWSKCPPFNARSIPRLVGHGFTSGMTCSLSVMH